MATHRIPQQRTFGSSDLQRSVKRTRIEHDARTVLDTRSSNADTALEVDHMILDYLGHQATIACLSEVVEVRPPKPNMGYLLPNLTQEASISAEYNVTLFNTFYKLFLSRHNQYDIDAEMRFRILLCKLIVLVTQRFTFCWATPSRHTLEGQRASNKMRARDWIGDANRVPSMARDIATALDEGLPLPAEQLERNRVRMLHEIGASTDMDKDPDVVFYGTDSCANLLDALPIFMQVSAARNALTGGNITESWMQLAGEFILQACLEQYLVCGAQGADALDEAFAWGYQDKADQDNGVHGDVARTFGDVVADKETNTMFEDEVYETEIEGWSDVKRSFFCQLFPFVDRDSSMSTSSPASSSPIGSDSEQANLISYLERAAAKHPAAEFKTKLLTFLGALASSTPKPVLLQLEMGQLDGMSQKETHDFLRSCQIEPTLLLHDFKVDQ